MPTQVRVTVYALAAMLALALLLSLVCRIDRIVVAGGRVISVDPTIVVQPLDTSIIRSLNVTVGQTVKKGQVLATLDPTFATADVNQLQQQAESLHAEVDRLTAERDQKPYAPRDARDGPTAMQLGIFRQRKAEFDAQLRQFDQKIGSLETGIARSNAEAAQLRKRVQVSTEIEGMRQELENRQVGSRLNRLLSTDARMELQRNADVAEKTARGGSYDLQALRSQREVYLQQWRSAIVSSLVEKTSALTQAEQQLQKARLRKDLVQLTSPYDAVVLEVAQVSVGSVMNPADRLFTLVPTGSSLEADVSIDGGDLGFVQVGDPVEIKLDAYRYLEHGTVKGVVRTISQDSFMQKANDQDPGRLVYRARVRVTEAKLRNVPADFRLMPGMPLSADIKVGTRTVFMYVMEGAIRNVDEAMREPQ